MKRRGFFASLAMLGLAPPALAALPAMRPDQGEAPSPEDAQYRGRRRRCRWETRQIRYRDRFGRVRFRTVRREVCW